MKKETKGEGFGKLLVVGGYTVLQKPNRALVFGVKNAKISVVARPSKIWEIKSSYGNWRGKDLSDISNSLLYVKHAIEESEVETPFSLNIKETEPFRPGRKIGLGSSAAVTVAVIKALKQNIHHSELFHRSYRAHNKSQGKIGSGFDIAASIYGSIIYERPSEKGKDFKVKQIEISPALYVKLFNIKDRGTSTPVSAKKVINTVKTDKKAKEIFSRLADVNEEAIDLFLDGNLREFLGILHKINVLRRKLGELSGVPIEPRELDRVRYVYEKKGFATILPGAGGYDSLLVLGLRPIPSIKHPLLEEVRVWLWRKPIRI